MTKSYSTNYNDFNSHCHICQKETDIRNVGGARLVFSCPDNNLEFVYENDFHTNHKTIQSNFIYINKNSFSYLEANKFPKIEYTKNYKELIARIIPRIEKLMVFL